MTSSIQSTPIIDPDFVVDAAKKHIIIHTGSNRSAVEFSQAAQKFLANVQHLVLIVCRNHTTDTLNSSTFCSDWPNPRPIVMPIERYRGIVVHH